LIAKRLSEQQHGIASSSQQPIFQYCIGQNNIISVDKALVDRGANDGICGADMLVFEGSG
jgi:hypothetical protein